jgi:limonene 1,2-monooxygenase
METHDLKYGIFLAPFHALDEDPTLCLQRDLQLVTHLDELGYHEAWIGEHHSAGFEIIASPELFMAAAVERTKRIRLGSGVMSLPYHNPLMAANRMIQLDHQSMGRVMFGVGPGLLPFDAAMLGIPDMKRRDMMVESLEAILKLLAGERVTLKTDWFELVDASCQLLPYTRPMPEIAVASSMTPSGGRMAGKHGLGMLCVAATVQGGFDVLDTNWNIADEIARETRGVPMDRRVLRLVGPMHIAPTREQARANVEYGLVKWRDYFSGINFTAADQDTSKHPVDAMIETGQAIIGTPDDAIEQIEKLWAKTGGFGTFLQLAHNWADFENTKKSYELFARHVIPHFRGANRRRVQSYSFAVANSTELMGKAMEAAAAMVEKHRVEREGQPAAAPAETGVAAGK